MTRPPVIILAAGANTRFFPFNHSFHKGIVSLQGKTLLERTLENLHQHGFDEVVIVVSPTEKERGAVQKIADSCQESFGTKVTLSVQTEANGMGSATLCGLKLLPENLKQVAIISPYHTTAGEMLDKMTTLGDSCLVTSSTTEPSRFGMIHFNSENKADGIIEKPAKGTEPSDQKILSIYLLSQTFLQILQSEPPAQYNFETALNSFLQTAPSPVLQLSEPLMSLKYPWDLFSFQTTFFAQLTSKIDPTAEISPTAVIDESNGPVHIKPHAAIGHASKIVGPAYIGTGAHIGDFCLIRESSLESDVRVGAHSEVARSIMMANSTIHRGYIGDSIIGTGVKIGAGFVSANKRFDRKTVGVEVNGKVEDSGRKALGTFIGDDAQIGVNVCTLPGKSIAAKSLVKPGTVVDQSIQKE